MVYCCKIIIISLVVGKIKRILTSTLEKNEITVYCLNMLMYFFNLFQESDENGINKLGCFGMCIIKYHS